MLVILSGSSGVGKNTIINRMLTECDKFELMTTVTTRAMREGGSPGNPYVFVSRDAFLGMLARGEMLEHCEIHG
ncbi:MAG: guanylate kinase, partial [Clostridia bacterium]